MKVYLDLLGFRVRDRITGAQGVVTSVCFDLYGCVQADINRGFDEKGEQLKGYWFDCKRLERVSEAPVMTPPRFEDFRVGDEPGPAEKPAPRP